MPCTMSKKETQEIYEDLCRKRCKGKTPHDGAEDKFAAPAKIVVHFRSDVFTHDFGLHPLKILYKYLRKFCVLSSFLI